jgi:metal-responsive CopG/Arc/MetJ family transcriptional regulator
MAKIGRPSTKGDDGVKHVGCEIPQELFDRLDAFRAEHYNPPRAQVIADAIERFLDQEAPIKGGKK